MTKTNQQTINGLLLVNKPQGLTSNAVLQRVKRHFNAKKAGHTGSLDPLATGMLPICFGEATKFSEYLLSADKCYDVVGVLGTKTSTADAMGEIIFQTTSFDCSLDQLQAVLCQFEGRIKQIPSMYSALKHQGQPLYKYARAGLEVTRKAREVIIHDLKLQQFDGKTMVLTVTCSKGTYIRNLIEDIGEKLGIGAHVTQLHRRYTAGFVEESMYSLEDLEHSAPEILKNYLLPMERMLSHLEAIKLEDHAVQALRYGQTVPCTTNNTSSQEVRLYNMMQEFMGIGELDPMGILKVKRLVASVT